MQLCPLLQLTGKLNDGVTEIPIEERNGNEVSEIEGWAGNEIVQFV